MRETKFIILISLQSFNLSFPLLLPVISTTILSFHLIPCIATLISYIFHISTQIPHIRTLIIRTNIPIPFPLLFSAFS